MPGVDRAEERVSWLLVALYLCVTSGGLTSTRQQILARIVEQRGHDPAWKSAIEKSFQLDAALVNDVFAACGRRMTRWETLVFFLRGLGCPYPEARARDLLGGAFDE